MEKKVNYYLQKLKWLAHNYAFVQVALQGRVNVSRMRVMGKLSLILKEIQLYPTHDFTEV